MIERRNLPKTNITNVTYTKNFSQYGKSNVAPLSSDSLLSAKRIPKRVSKGAQTNAARKSY